MKSNKNLAITESFRHEDLFGLLKKIGWQADYKLESQLIQELRPKLFKQLYGLQDNVNRTVRQLSNADN